MVRRKCLFLAVSPSRFLINPTRNAPPLGSYMTRRTERGIVDKVQWTEQLNDDVYGRWKVGSRKPLSAAKRPRRSTTRAGLISGAIECKGKTRTVVRIAQSRPSRACQSMGRNAGPLQAEWASKHTAGFDGLHKR